MASTLFLALLSKHRGSNGWHWSANSQNHPVPLAWMPKFTAMSMVSASSMAGKFLSLVRKRIGTSCTQRPKGLMVSVASLYTPARLGCHSATRGEQPVAGDAEFREDYFCWTCFTNSTDTPAMSAICSTVKDIFAKRFFTNRISAFSSPFSSPLSKPIM